MLEWELSKLKHGMSSHWTINQKYKKIEQTKPKTVDELFKGVKIGVDINEIVGQVAGDIHNKQNRIDNIEDKLRIYEHNFEDNNNQRLLTIHKLDKFINTYKNLKAKYTELVKKFKNKKQVKVDIEEDYELSD
jgi:hypothetical protein